MGPANGESDVPLPVPYSLDEADGIVAASCDAVAAVVALEFALEDTELTLTGVSIGSVFVVVEVPTDEPVVVSVVDDGGETPAARLFEPLDALEGAAVAILVCAVDVCVAEEADVALAAGVALVAALPVPPVLDDAEPFAPDVPAALEVEPAPADELPVVPDVPPDVPALLLPIEPLPLPDAELPAADEPPPEVPEPPVLLVLAEVPA